MQAENRLGLAIAKYRAERGLSQNALARAVGISRPYLTQIENGTRFPSDNTANAIFRALGVPLEQLIQEHLTGAIPDDQQASLTQMIRGYDILQQYLDPGQMEEIMASLGSMEQLEAALRTLQGEPMPPGPEGWLELSKEDRRLIQRLVNRLRGSE